MQVFSTPVKFPVLVQVIPTCDQTDLQVEIATEFTAQRLMERSPEPDNTNRFWVKGSATLKILLRYGLLDQGTKGYGSESQR